MTESEILGILEEFLESGDIAGKTVNQGNLERFNEANLIAMALFSPRKVSINPPQQNLSFAEVSMSAERVEVEGAMQLEKYQRFLELVDYLNISPIDATTLGIYYSVDNVWEE